MLIHTYIYVYICTYRFIYFIIYICIHISIFVYLCVYTLAVVLREYTQKRIARLASQYNGNGLGQSLGSEVIKLGIRRPRNKER